jgi:CRISP-associated protein Cas1
MELIVEGRGLFLGKHQGRLRVSQQGNMIREAPIIHLTLVLIIGTGVSISSDVIATCAEEGIPIYCLDTLGRPTASLYSAGLIGTVLTRRAQLTAFTDQRGAHLARTFVSGKLANQSRLLHYMARTRNETNPDLAQYLTQSAAIVMDHAAMANELPLTTVDAMRDQLLSIEGRGAQAYWEAIGVVIPERLAWPGRHTQGAPDDFNAALNYSYGVLYAAVERALVLAGLDPYGGFLHVDRPNKPSLVLDLIEEFRQTVVDRTLVGLVNRGVCIGRDEEQRIDAGTRTMLATKILERLESAELYEGKRQPLRCIMQSQARHLATYVRGDRETYTAFVASI